jgi:hypothetical protein
MPKRISTKLTDANEIASAVVAASLNDEPVTDKALLSKVMSEMGRRGGKIGGKKTAANMTPAQRKKRARKAAQTRWNSK